MENMEVLIVLLATNMLMWAAMRSLKPKACPVRTKNYTLGACAPRI